MKIIKLPAMLPGALDLAMVNQQLRDRTAQLDWGAVVSASEKHLAVLLAGLDLSNDADVLDCEDSTLSDTIAEKVVQVLQALPKQTKTAKAVPNPTKVAPTVWQQPSLVEPQFVATAQEQGEGQGKLIEMQFVPVNPQEVKHSATENTDSPEQPLASNPSPILKPPSHYQIRAELEQAVLADLLGPAGGEYEEVDEARVSDRYLVGLLAPLHRRTRPAPTDDPSKPTDDPAAAETGTVDESPEQFDELAVGGTGTIEDGTTETTNPVIETMFPSSLGMSFCVSGTAKAIKIKAGWGQYERAKSESLETPTGAPKTVWRR